MILLLQKSFLSSASFFRKAVYRDKPMNVMKTKLPFTNAPGHFATAFILFFGVLTSCGAVLISYEDERSKALLNAGMLHLEQILELIKKG